MIWWVLIGVIVAFFILRQMWRAYTHPYHTLIRQAANMDWVAAGTHKTTSGYSNMRLRRNDLLAEVSFEDINVRLLQPEVARTFRDFLEVERWLGARTSLASRKTSEEEVPGQPEAARNVGYFAKVDNLLSAKGLKEEFKTLQGWDGDYGEATARVCAMGEKCSEPPAVIAAFMVESLGYYHKNRDISLSYLARLESGLREKAANPDLYAEIDAEARSKEIAYDIVTELDLDSDSPEASYIREVVEFLQSVDYYDELVLPAQEDEAFMAASANVYMAGYQTGSSPKVIGALVADGANKFQANETLGILFLDRVAKNIMDKFEKELRSETRRITDGASSDSSERSDRNKTNSTSVVFNLNASAGYHDLLDAVSAHARKYLERIASAGQSKVSPNLMALYAEMVLFVLACKARKESVSSVHSMNWNTFKSGVEVRMLCIKDDGHQRSGVIRGANGEEVLATFASSYWTRLDSLESISESGGALEAFRQILGEMGVGVSGKEELSRFLNETSSEVSRVLIPKISKLG